MLFVRRPSSILFCGRTRTTQLASTYYDTAKAELRAAGVALRVRRDGRRWVQTVKGEGSVTAGLHTREEYEWPIGSARIDGRKLLETPWRAMFASTAPRLKPIFKTHFARTTQPLRFADGTRATLCLDRGEIRAGHRRASLAEIELELVEGRAERLYELALALAADLPVTVALDSKAERGFALAHPIAPQPVRARMVCVARDSRLGTALAGVAADCLRQAVPGGFLLE